MFRFSVEENVPVDTNASQLTSQGITRDEDFGQRLQNAGEYQGGEVYYRVENANPRNVQEAVDFVQGIFFHPPKRVWLDEDLYEVTDEHLTRSRKPSAPK